MTNTLLSGRTAVAGVGMRQYRRGTAPLPERGVLVQAIVEACEDAGFDPADIDGVKKVQAGYKVQPLSAFLGKPAPAAAAEADFVKPLTPSLVAASSPKKMSKSCATGRRASSSSALRATRSTRLCARIQRLRTPRRRSSFASARLRGG